MTTVAELDAAGDDRAAELLRECCGSSRWVREMIARRPFGSRDVVLRAADEIWDSLDARDWLEAFSHHPRIGESASGVAGREQSGIASAGNQTLRDLGEANRDYERRFGYIYIVCATGKSAEEMLAIARERLKNDPDTELGVAAHEQQKITRLRLQKLLEDER